MDISKELIERFLRDQCSPEEAARVAHYLNDHPEELNAYPDLMQKPDAGGGARLHPALSDKMLQVIRKETYERVHFFAGWKYAAAACLLAIFSVAGFKLFNGPKNTQPAPVTVSKTGNTPAMPVLRSATNPTNKTFVMNLEDGSTVSLEPNSTLQYYSPFEPNARRLYLSGTAFFKVAQDKNRPFSVSAEGFVTTALGTSFVINAGQRSHTLIVQLYTGKVSVNKLTGEASFKELYLSPGEQVQIDRATFVSRIGRIKEPDQWKDNRKNSLPEPVPDNLSFQQTPLPAIFKLLEKRYQLEIGFSEKQLARMSFTGKFNHEESAISILNTIAEINGLIVIKTDQGYEIKK